jgi:hypothetical protein
MAGETRNPYKWAGRMGIGSGPVPLSHWYPQPSVQATVPRDKGVMPDAGKEQTQRTRPEKKA